MCIRDRAGIEYYQPLFFANDRKGDTSTATLFDYLPSAMPVLCDGALEASEHAWQQIEHRYDQLRHDIERPLLPPSELWLAPDALRERLNQGNRIEICNAQHHRLSLIHISIVSLGIPSSQE